MEGHAKRLRRDLAGFLRPQFGEYASEKIFINGEPLKAALNSRSLKKLACDVAIAKTQANGFGIEDHFEAARRIVSLFKNADLVKTRADKNGDKNIISIKRLSCPFVLESGRKAIAYITVKETVQNGHKIYSVEILDVKKAADVSRKGSLDRSKSVLDTEDIVTHPVKKNK